MAFPYYCSKAQRELALDLMRQLELDERVVTLMTIRVFGLAKLPPPHEGASLDTAVGELSPNQCSALIDALKREIGDEEEVDA